MYRKLYHGTLFINDEKITDQAFGVGIICPYNFSFSDSDITIKSIMGVEMISYEDISEVTLSLVGRLGRSFLTGCNLDLIIVDKNGNESRFEFPPTNAINQLKDILSKAWLEVKDPYDLYKVLKQCNNGSESFARYLSADINKYKKKFGIENPRVGYDLEQ